MILYLYKMIQQRYHRKSIYSKSTYWDYKAKTYKNTAVSMWPNASLNYLYDIEQKKWVSDCLKNVSGVKLLDLGCGTGRFSRWFVEQGAQVTGIDFSNDSLAIAKDQSDGVNPSYIHASVFELSEKNIYDVIFIWGVLSVACKDRQQLVSVLENVRASLREDGCLLLTEPIHTGFLHRVLDLSLKEFLEVMQEAGFRVKLVIPLHFWPMRLMLAYIPWPMWFTRIMYKFGQYIMKFPGFSRLGDYSGILAYPI